MGQPLHNVSSENHQRIGLRDQRTRIQRRHADHDRVLCHLVSSVQRRDPTPGRDAPEVPERVPRLHLQRRQGQGGEPEEEHAHDGQVQPGCGPEQGRTGEVHGGAGRRGHPTLLRFRQERRHGLARTPNGRPVCQRAGEAQQVNYISISVQNHFFR